MPTLRDIRDQRVREADPNLVEDLGNNRVRCFSCGHCCPIPEGQAGVCKVRFNRGGNLFVPWGYTAGMQCDPIEKKPSSMLIPELLPTASACSAATCTVATARIG